jgi:septum formation protein
MSDALSPFWLSSAPLILASKSAGRQLVLRQAKIPFIAAPADVDERAIETKIVAEGGDADAVALALAGAKALAASRSQGDALVLGADQVAGCGAQLFGKPATRAEAGAQLQRLSGRTHRLYSAIALAQGGALRFETVAHADLAMRPLSGAFIEAYLDAMGDSVCATAGGYQIEGLGAHLFERVAGDHWTIIGLPLLPLCDALRRLGVLKS